MTSLNIAVTDHASTAAAKLLSALQGADLQGANLARCILCDANLDGVKITYRNEVVRVRFEMIE